MTNVIINPTDDAYISLLNSNINYGFSSLLFTGKFVQPTDVFRSLLKFDLSGVVPTDNHVINASLNLFVFRKDQPDATLSPQTIKVFTNESDFSEDTVTWNNAPIINPTTYSIDVTDGDVGNYISIDITVLVGKWLNNTIPNYGVTLVGLENIIDTIIGYFSKEWSVTIQRPFLSIEFTPTNTTCSTPISSIIPPATVSGTIFTINSVILDSSLLYNPTVNVEFASNINIVAPVPFTGTINFQVFKLCNGQTTPVPVGPSWTLNLVLSLSSQTFSFFVCDSNSCDYDSCTYTVIATVTSRITVGILSINNATLKVTAKC